MRAALLLAGLLAVPVAVAGPTAQTGAYAGSWCDDHTGCWWYESCGYEAIDGPCMGWLSAQHAWGFSVCAGDEPALAQWSVVALDGVVDAGQQRLDPHECVEHRARGATPLVDCALVQVSIVPLVVGTAPLVSHAFDCGSSFFTM